MVSSVRAVHRRPSLVMKRGISRIEPTESATVSPTLNSHSVADYPNRTILDPTLLKACRSLRSGISRGEGLLKVKSLTVLRTVVELVRPVGDERLGFA